MIELIVLGTSVGILSGFFGIGGGTIIIPVLLLLGYTIKDAVSISIVQMVFSSIYGSYINNKKDTLDILLVLYIGIGGFVGGLLSGFITESLSDKTLEIIFLIFTVLAILKMFFQTQERCKQVKLNKIWLFSIGLILSLVSMTIGVGGSILLIPILVGFLHVELKKAISAGLFFIIFTSISGLISHTISRDIDFQSGITIGIASLFGVYIGIIFKDKVNSILQKRLLVGFYTLVIIYLINRVFING